MPNIISLENDAKKSKYYSSIGDFLHFDWDWDKFSSILSRNDNGPDSLLSKQTTLDTTEKPYFWDQTLTVDGSAHDLIQDKIQFNWLFNFQILKN